MNTYEATITYSVRGYETLRVLIKAENIEEARESLKSGDYDECIETIETEVNADHPRRPDIEDIELTEGEEPSED